jgi:uncharacterized protein (TIGR02217 family)
MSFHDIQFPTDISYGSVGGPGFLTEVIEMSSGYEQRNQKWVYPRERWNVAYGIKTKALLITLRDFFMARRGRAYGFRFKNHDDYEGIFQEIGLGDGSTVDFQLIKTYTDDGGSIDRKITRPVSGTVTVYKDSVEQVSGWTCDYDTGIITFGAAPDSGEVVTADFEFDVPMRFDTDYLPIAFSEYEARAVNVPIVEIKE